MFMAAIARASVSAEDDRGVAYALAARQGETSVGPSGPAAMPPFGEPFELALVPAEGADLAKALAAKTIDVKIGALLFRGVKLPEP